jgi:hypothetical protein
VTRSEFLELVREEKVRPDSFSFEGGDERYVLSVEGSVWRTFYRERGIERGVQMFVSESDALEHLLELLRNDPTTLSL